ncbi:MULTISPECIES: DNA helicase RecQ [Methylosinus]|uniref:DNA helicase RecQ n=1 Tax=Methylosinus trichosporium (strain ATCC 35070 / NCIMB 11131 / UNIQEM 75 / OB3b) TaxID=595536 RepID=A0A2D2D5L6_METT3|nr:MULTISPECIES: DNA helicase RecQ [Methylosinus]ATQ70119.1 DNA helicase RecQ [Methylosinus trichosporium OB3b]OBS54379.1 ATP-dependent DNA helicase RecQ [Methylosinus sp. 3S-1]
MSQLPKKARALLKSVFGYEDFRPGQAEIIAAVLAGEGVLAIMPTGSGKSMCYQLPALVDERLTVVVSPLIALMRDQVRQMRACGVSAATLNSMNDAQENDEARRALRSGELRLLFVSPERLFAPGVLDTLARAGARRLAIDEAHCVSEWGHDFRPEYRDLGAAAEALGAQVVGLTATADKATRADIAKRLFKTDPHVFLHSFDRPNLALNFVAKDQPRRQLTRFLDKHRGESGIVYCSSRDATEKLAEFFAEQGHQTICYHARLDQAVRNRNQDRFLQEDGIIAVATIAFGMGVNKPDVRFVAHADMPSSVESYYQEIGRAGRDGLPADTLTLYGLDDMAFRRRQIDQKDVDDERKRVEHDRFSALAMLCETPVCRRQTLLAYFDEESPPCGRCDICLQQVKIYDGTVDAQKALSAAMRTGQRFGANYLAEILIGAATEAVRRNGHETIKTFGVGKDRTKQEWSGIIRQLFAARAFASTEHGGFMLTPKGEDILFGRAQISLRLDALAPRERRKEAPRGEKLDAADDRVLAALKRKRLELAREAGLPAFMIFPDRTLIEMASRRPATLAEMRMVQGVGEHKLSQYGEVFLEALQEALR